MEKLTLTISFIFFASTMFAIGLQTDKSFFLSHKNLIRLLLPALIVNYAVIPLLSLAILKLVPLKTGIESGLLILAVAPGAPLVIQFSGKAKKDLSFSSQLLLLFSILDLALTPFLAGLLLHGIPIHVDYHRLLSITILFLLIPLFAGMTVKHNFGSISLHLIKPAEIVAMIAFPAIIVATFSLRSEAVRSIGLVPLLLILFLQIVFMSAGWIAGGRLKSDRIILAHNSGMRNTAIAYAISLTSDMASQTTLTIAAFSALMIPVNLIFSLYQSRFTNGQ